MDFWPVFPLTRPNTFGPGVLEGVSARKFRDLRLMATRNPAIVHQLRLVGYPMVFAKALYNPWWENSPDFFHQQPGWSVTPAENQSF